MDKTKVVVLAAGLSTRLRNIEGHIPKVLVKIGGHPIIEYVIRNLALQGYKDIIVTTHYKEHMIREALGDGSQFSAKITYVNESILLDTAGSIKRISKELNEDFLVCGGSFILPEIHIGDFVKFHKEKGGIVSIALSKCADDELLPYYGQAILDDTNRIRGFAEKPNEMISSYIHTTYQMISPRFFDYYSENLKISIPEVISKIIREEGEIYGYLTKQMVINISNEILLKSARNNDYFNGYSFM